MDYDQEKTERIPLPFSEEEERQIEILVEAWRRLLTGYTVSQPTHASAAEPVTEPIVTADTSNDELQPPNREYSERRRNVLSYIMVTWKQAGLGLLLVIGLWVLVGVLPGYLYDVQPWSETSLNIGLISVGITLLIVIIFVAIDIQNFKRWRNWTIEVTESEIIIRQKRSIIGRLNDEKYVLRRSRIDNIKVSRKWYFALLRINAYTVTLDAPGEEDQAFHGLIYIKDGDLLEELLNYRAV